MTIEKEIQIGKFLMSLGIFNYFYHSVRLIKDSNTGGKIPSFPNGAEFLTAGPDDTKGRFCYIRLNGTVTFNIEKGISSEDVLYKYNAPLRIVIFNDNEEANINDILTDCLKIGFLKGVRLVSYINDPFQVNEIESSFYDFDIDGKILYLAIDVIASDYFTENNCKKEYCQTYINPFTL